MKEKSKQAFLIAGMHRSGTSALTRALSFMGADLPENLASALPDNNETGFWESVDLMILHDKLLASAGSSWKDWTPFNTTWYKSAVADKFMNKILSVVQNDFADSSLFVVKDPRICRFLPFWLDVLKRSSTKPYIVIPIRNPLEVAQSLKARDGLPLATGGLVWLRHVLDAMYFSESYPRALVSYRDLIQDWHLVIDSISDQLDVSFPRISISSELEVEQYLDPRQKHNHASLTDVKRCREFSPLLVSVYETLLALLEDPNQESLLEKIDSARREFDVTSFQYGKVLQAAEQSYQKALLKSDQQSADYEGRLEQQSADYEGRLEQQSADYEGRLEQQSADYEGRLEQQSADYEGRLEQQSADYEGRLAQQFTDYESRLDQQSADYESRLAQQSTDYEGRLAQQSADYDRQYQLIIDTHHNQLIENHRDYETILSALDAQKADIVQTLSTVRRSLQKLRREYVEAWEDKKGFAAKNTVLTVKRLRKKNPLVSLVKESVFFDAVYYLAGRNSKEITGNVGEVECFLAQSEDKINPHPLFDIDWYLHQYPDIVQARINPLVHFIKYGAAELRCPHPLFDAKFYREQYPESEVAGLSPLEHYLKYGVEWGLKPHPLFDPVFYIRQLHESLDKGFSPLIHYLQNQYAWRYSPSEAFDGGWYLEQHRDVAESDINPLLHYIVRGAAEGRKPHPEFENEDFREQFYSLFIQAGILEPSSVIPRADKLILSTKGKTASDLSNRKQLVTDQRFSRMLQFPRTKLKPDSSVFMQDNLTIHWVTCDFAPKGGGGNMTIFRFARLFELAGHQQHIWLHNNPVHQTESSAYEDLVRNYQQLSAQIHFVNGNEQLLEEARGDIIIATDWESVWPVLSVCNFKRRFYFVQDHEPSFFPAGGHSLAAEMTYHEDLDCVCAGPWLEQLMQNKYGRWATKFWLAADKKSYFPSDQPVTNKVPRIAFYARRHTERRAVDLGLLALEYLMDTGLQFHVDVYGDDDNDTLLSAVSFSFTDHGILDAKALGELYRQCDIGVVFSATNYSLVPQEMMVCGLAVLEMDGENTRIVFPDDVVTLVKPHPENIAEGLRELLSDKNKRIQQAEKGRLWAAQFDWSVEAAKVSENMQSRLIDLGYKSVPSSMDNAYKASVIIPTLNGGELLLKVLNMVRKQKTPWPFEILVIDSGSNDGSLEEVCMSEDIQVYSIPKSEFNHGGTRNLGIELTTGEYIAFLTQDALPTDEFWLFNLISMLEHDPEAAGAFGRHLPYLGASAFVKRDLLAHFDNLAKFPLYLDRNTDRRKYDSGDQGWRQVLHFYSDNNSCMRRSVWKDIPYPVIEYGEDQVWADLIIKAGYKKAYAINAVVYHSHDYNEQENYERSKTEAAFFKKYFGYELVSDRYGINKTIAALNQADEIYGRENLVADEVIEHQKKLNQARLTGYRDALFSLS